MGSFRCIIAFLSFLFNLHYIICNLFCSQMIFQQYLFHVIPVNELFFQSVVQNLHVTVAIETCDLLSKSTLSIRDISIACGFSDMAYFANCYKKFYNISPSKMRNIIWIDHCRYSSCLFPDQVCCLSCKSVECSKSDDRNF